MHHIAIMKKSLGLLPKVVSGEKTIESRFYNSRRAPWRKIKVGDTVFFKNSGEPVTVSATVSEVLENPKNLDAYKLSICLTDLPKKKYSILIFLTSVQKIEPFEINKKGFGSMSAWITVSDINKIKQ